MSETGRRDPAPGILIRWRHTCGAHPCLPIVLNTVEAAGAELPWDTDHRLQKEAAMSIQHDHTDLSHEDLFLAIPLRLGCCKLTLEVLEGDRVARAVYRSCGFSP